MASRPVPQPRSRTRGPQTLRQRQEELRRVIDAAILGVVANGIIVLVDAGARRETRVYTRTTCTSVTGFLP